MIKATTHRELSILLNNTNKALEHVIKESAPSALKTVSQSKDLQSIINSVLQEAGKNSASNSALLNLVKNNPTLKNLGASAQTIADIIATLKAEKNPLPIEKTLQKFFVDIQDLKGSTLKEKLHNSGLFLESKLKHIMQLTTTNKEPLQEIKQNDLKALLHTAKEELSKLEQPRTQLIQHIDKLALQIDHAQLLSHLSNANALYLPFHWDAMKEGHITIQKETPQKFNVDIDLTLKEYGSLHLKLAIYDKNQLNIHIYTQNKALQTLIKANLQELRSNLIAQHITPREIRLFNKMQTQATTPYETNTQDIYMGFEVKA